MISEEFTRSSETYLLPRYRAIVALDIADFTSPVRTELHRREMHDGLYKIARIAFDEAGIGWDRCEHEDRGDGILVLLPPDCPHVQLADGLLGRLVAGLLRYNEVHAGQAVIQLRIALHAGEVRSAAHGKTGEAVNFATRILDAEEGKAGLRRPGGILAAIASDRFYQDVIAPDPATGRGFFRRVPVTVKRTRDVAWLRILHSAALVGAESEALDTLDDADLELLRFDGSF